jgi:hypothetical protein
MAFEKIGEFKIAQPNTQHPGIFTNVFIRHETYQKYLPKKEWISDYAI